jgi:chromosome segregation ATPase
MSTLKSYTERIRRLDNKIAVSKNKIKDWESKIKEVVGSTEPARIEAHRKELNKQIENYTAKRDELLEEIQEALDAIERY